MTERVCAIIGASHAGVSLALQLRKEGWDGQIRLISAETELPYHRPPLSKDYLAGNKTLDSIRLRPGKLYQDNNIELLLGTEVAQIDRQAKRLFMSRSSESDSGDLEIGRYDKLVLCTGATVRKLAMAQPFANVFYIRQASDVSPLAAQIAPGKRAVVIGAGYIGLETAAVMAQKGVEVTVLEAEERILKRVTSAPMSDYMTALHRHHGVEIVTNTKVLNFVGGHNIEKVVCMEHGVELKDYEADFVIIGIGVTPETRLAQDAGLEVDGGIVVDQFTQTSDADIFAAGDCCRFPSALFDRQLRLESVQNANDQARAAAANICGKQLAYNGLPWFWSDQYTIKLQMAGLSQGYDQLVIRGDSKNPEGAGFALFYLKDSVVIASDCVGRPKEFMVSKLMVKDRLKIDPSRLEDESIPPNEFVAKD